MITAAGLNMIANLTGYTGTPTPAAFTHIAYGYGTTAPASGDTALEHQTGARVAATIETISVVKPNDTVRFSAKVVSAAATYPATNPLTEIGVFTAATGGTMILRRLVVPAITYKLGDTLSLIATATVKNYADGGTNASW